MNWDEVVLSDILEIKHGYAFKGEYFSEEETNNILLTPGNFMIGGGYKDTKLKYYKGEIPKDYILKHNDIIVTMTDLSKDGDTLGFSAKIPYQPSKVFLHNQRIGLLIFKDDKYDKEFIYWLFRTREYQKFVTGSSSGATVKHTSPSRILTFKFKFPPLKTQKKIASILSNYDKLIENNNQRIKLLESMAEEIYKEWFVRLRFPEFEKVEVLDGVPDGWEKREITSIAHINKNIISLSSAPKEIVYLDIASVNTGFYNTSEYMDFDNAPSRARRVLNYGDTIFSTVRPNRKAFSLILEKSDNLIASTGFAVLTPKRIEDFAFIYLSISQQSFVESVVAKATGATYPAINQKNFEKLEILIPSDDILNLFSKQVVSLLEMKQKLLEKNKNLKETRDLLLPKLIHGTLKV